MDETLLGPVKWIVDLIRPLLVWTGVQEGWLLVAALNTVLLTKFVADTFKWMGWKVVAVAGGWAALYAVAEYQPSVVGVVAGAASVFVMTALALKAAGKLGGFASKGVDRMKPLANPSVRDD